MKTSRGFSINNRSHPGFHCLIVLICLGIFWLYRTQHFSGDGALIARITQGGKWIVKNELLAQALLQGVFRLLSPWHITPLEAMNILSCISTAATMGVLLHYNRSLFHLSFYWPLLLYASSGFLIYGFGHTEYYPLLLPWMFLYGFWSLEYLRGRRGIFPVAFLFVLAAGFHFAMLIALPSLLLLPWLSGRREDFRRVGVTLLFLLLYGVIRNFPQWLGYKAAGLSPAWNVLPLFPEEHMIRHYAFFDWRHLCDWFYAWAMRSWLFWPAIFYAIGCLGGRSLLEPERLFLLVYTLCFTLWSTVWHPDLGITADWDLFALEVAPCLLLLLSYLPLLQIDSFFRTSLITACMASTCVLFSFVLQKADFPRAGYGSITFSEAPQAPARLILNGLSYELPIPRIPAGSYQAKWIDNANRQSHDLFIVVVPGRTTVIRGESP